MYEDDAALIEMTVRAATHGQQLVGPYSRFGWSHPGPAAAYLLAPVYVAGGRRSQALVLGSLLITAGASLLFVLASTSAGGAAGGWIATTVLSVLLAELGPRIVASPWGPHLTIVPLAAFLAVAAALATGSPRWLPVAAAVGTFLVQTHLGQVPIVFAVGAAALGFGLVRARGEPDRFRPFLRPSIAAAIVLAIGWAPPALEQLTRKPGNLRQIAEFLSTSGGAHRWAEVFEGLARQIGSIPMGIARLTVPSTSDERLLGAGTFFLLLVAALPAIAVLCRARGDDVRAVPVTLASLAVAVAIWSAIHIRGEVIDYLLLFGAAVAVFGWTALGAALASFSRGTRTARGIGVALAAAIVVLATKSQIRELRVDPPMATQPLAPIDALRSDVARWLLEQHARRPLVRIATHDAWIPAAGLLNELERVGVTAAVEDDWASMYPDAFHALGSEDRTLLIGSATWAAQQEGRPDLLLVSKAGATAVLAETDREWLPRHIHAGPLELVETVGTVGDARHVVESGKPVDGMVWNDPAFVVLKDRASFLTVKLPVAEAIGVLVAADSDDTYRVQGSLDGVSWTDVGDAGPLPGPGVQTRALFSPRISGARFLRVSAIAGDGNFSLARIQVVVK